MSKTSDVIKKINDLSPPVYVPLQQHINDIFQNAKTYIRRDDSFGNYNRIKESVEKIFSENYDKLKKTKERLTKLKTIVEKEKHKPNDKAKILTAIGEKLKLLQINYDEFIDAQLSKVTFTSLKDNLEKHLSTVTKSINEIELKSSEANKIPLFKHHKNEISSIKNEVSNLKKPTSTFKKDKDIDGAIKSICTELEKYCQVSTKINILVEDSNRFNRNAPTTKDKQFLKNNLFLVNAIQAGKNELKALKSNEQQEKIKEKLINSAISAHLPLYHKEEAERILNDIDEIKTKLNSASIDIKERTILLKSYKSQLAQLNLEIRKIKDINTGELENLITLIKNELNSIVSAHNEIYEQSIGDLNIHSDNLQKSMKLLNEGSYIKLENASDEEICALKAHFNSEKIKVSYPDLSKKIKEIRKYATNLIKENREVFSSIFKSLKLRQKIANQKAHIDKDISKLDNNYKEAKRQYDLLFRSNPNKTLKAEERKATKSAISEIKLAEESSNKVNHKTFETLSKYTKSNDNVKKVLNRKLNAIANNYKVHLESVKEVFEVNKKCTRNITSSLKNINEIIKNKNDMAVKVDKLKSVYQDIEKINIATKNITIAKHNKDQKEARATDERQKKTIARINELEANKVDINLKEKYLARPSYHNKFDNFINSKLNGIQNKLIADTKIDVDLDSITIQSSIETLNSTLATIEKNIGANDKLFDTEKSLIETYFNQYLSEKNLTVDDFITEIKNDFKKMKESEVKVKGVKKISLEAGNQYINNLLETKDFLKICKLVIKQNTQDLINNDLKNRFSKISELKTKIETQKDNYQNTLTGLNENLKVYEKIKEQYQNFIRSQSNREIEIKAAGLNNSFTEKVINTFKELAKQTYKEITPAKNSMDKLDNEGANNKNKSRINQNLLLMELPAFNTQYKNKFIPNNENLDSMKKLKTQAIRDTLRQETSNIINGVKPDINKLFEDTNNDTRYNEQIKTMISGVKKEFDDALNAITIIHNNFNNNTSEQELINLSKQFFPEQEKFRVAKEHAEQLVDIMPQILNQQGNADADTTSVKYIDAIENAVHKDVKQFQIRKSKFFQEYPTGIYELQNNRILLYKKDSDGQKVVKSDPTAYELSTLKILSSALLRKSPRRKQDTDVFYRKQFNNFKELFYLRTSQELELLKINDYKIDSIQIEKLSNMIKNTANLFKTLNKQLADTKVDKNSEAHQLTFNFMKSVGQQLVYLYLGYQNVLQNQDEAMVNSIIENKQVPIPGKIDSKAEAVKKVRHALEVTKQVIQGDNPRKSFRP